MLTHPEPGPPRGLEERWSTWAAGGARRAAARRKLAIFDEQHQPLVEALIRARIQETGVATQVLRFADRSPNLLRSVVNAVAVCYSRGCRREPEGLGEAAGTAFADLITETGIDRLAPLINAASWLAGPTIVLPWLDRRGRMALDVVLARSSDVKAERDVVEAVVWNRGDDVWVEVDGDAWRYYADGELLRSAPHGTGACPAVVFRADLSLSDWWSGDAHAGLTDATLTVGYKVALGQWTRQVSGNRLTVIYGDIEGVAPGQTISHHGMPLFLGPKGSAGAEVLDRSVPAGDWLQEVRAICTMAVAAYGLPPSSVTFENNNNDWGVVAIAVRGEALSLLRNRQVPHLRAAELELWPLVCDVARAAGHRLAPQLPPGDEVRDALRVQFPDIAQPAETRARLDALAAALPYGLASPEDFLLAARPELTRAEAVEELQRNRELELERLEALAVRNVAATPDRGLQSIAQLQGRDGGLQSGAQRRENTT